MTPGAWARHDVTASRHASPKDERKAYRTGWRRCGGFTVLPCDCFTASDGRSSLRTGVAVRNDIRCGKIMASQQSRGNDAYPHG
jgi:hypothetical protein